MAAEKLTMNRIEELRDGSGIKKDEWDELFTLAKKQIEDNDAHTTELDNRQAALGTHMENLRQCAVKLTDSERLRHLIAIDLGGCEAHCESLIRRLQDSLAKEKTMCGWHKAYERAVNDCIDHKPLAPVTQLNPTLLRLQEALDAKTDK